jgi:phthiodiolone/phenolphthiodiolone dimycocerosates ketoreductase
MQDHVSFTMDEKTIREQSTRVPLSVVKGMVLNGTVDDVQQAAVWRDHGVRYIVTVNFGPMQPSLRGALRTVLPVQQSGPRTQAAVICAR